MQAGPPSPGTSGPPDGARERGRRRALRGPSALAPVEPSWTARALAVALTLLMLAAVLLSIGVGPGAPRATEERAPGGETPTPERLVFVPISPAPSAAVPPSPGRAAAPSAAPRVGFPFRGAAPSPDTTGPRPGPRDSAAAAGGAPRAAPSSVPSPRAVFTPPPCPAPCLEKGGKPRTRGGAGVLANGEGEPALSAAERDSILREAARRTVNAPRDGSSGRVGAGDPPAPGAPPQQSGISIPIGLPGGGPTRAERKRDSTLNADVTARLARIRARADSIAAAARRDSTGRP